MMNNNEEHNDEIGNNHIATNTHNPIREDAFDIFSDPIFLINIFPPS